MTNEEALNVLHRYQRKEYNALIFDDALDTAVKALEKEVTHGWIPVKDRMPDECGTYLCSGKIPGDKDINRVFTAGYNATTNDFFWIEGGLEIYGFNVLAWQPLPEHYDAEVL